MNAGDGLGVGSGSSVGGEVGVTVGAMLSSGGMAAVGSGLDPEHAKLPVASRIINPTIILPLMHAPACSLRSSFRLVKLRRRLHYIAPSCQWVGAFSSIHNLHLENNSVGAGPPRANASIAAFPPSL